MNVDPKTTTGTSANSDRKQVPFFARFLESQADVRVQTDVKAGAWPPLEQTMKAPSDSDEF